MNSLKKFLSTLESTFSSRGHQNLPEDDVFICYYISNHPQWAAVSGLCTQQCAPNIFAQRVMPQKNKE